MARYKITLAYDGTGFFGWQRQPDKRSVQGTVEQALENIYQTPVSIMASGRTDEGVHAYGQVAHFDAPDSIAGERLIGALNFYLPQSVRVLECVEVSLDFHARMGAKKKTYCYDMYQSAVDCPFLLNRATNLGGNCDVAVMKAATEIFVGTHDFNAFRAKGSSAKTTIRTVTACNIADVLMFGQTGFRLSITADGFLYKMVRIIAGTLIRVGNGKLSEGEIKRLLEAGQEWDKKVTAPSGGLYLYRVAYDE